MFEPNVSRDGEDERGSCCWSSSVSMYSQRAPSRRSVGTCRQHPGVTFQAPTFSEFFQFVRSLVCPRSPGSPSSLVLLVNTVVPLLLAVQENSQPCGRVHMFAMGVLYTTAQTMNEITITGVMVTQDPTVIPEARGKKRARNLGPALRTCPRDEVTRKRFRNTKWTPRDLAFDLVPITAHDIDEEGLSFYFCTISQYGSTALHWTVAFDKSCLGGEDTTMFA